MIKRLLLNQRINFTSETDINHKETLIDILSKSQRYKAVDYKELARGGEAVVYRVEHIGTDEVVAKCSLKDNCLEDIMTETQMLKLIKNKDLICDVKEEIIEIN